MRKCTALLRETGNRALQSELMFATASGLKNPIVVVIVIVIFLFILLLLLVFLLLVGHPEGVT